MDYKKKYEEAERLYRTANADQRYVLESLFPKLRESEDDRISKEIIKYLEQTVPHHHRDEVLKSKEWIAWLEKQGEQKLPIEKLPSEMKTIEESLGFTTQKECDKYNQMVSDLIMSDDDKVKLKFKIGDWVVFDGETLHITNVTENGYSTEDGVIPFRCEKETKLWTIADANGGDVLTNGDFPCIFKRCDGNGSLYVYCGINAHNDFSILSEDSENIWDDYSKQYFPATKEQRALLFQKMKEAGYEWDAEKKELKKIEQKSAAWSEDDENVLDDIEEAIINYWHGDTQDILLDWLKSLKDRVQPQNTWKPSDEQMEALWNTLHPDDPFYVDLSSLYNDLKKLTEE